MNKPEFIDQNEYEYRALVVRELIAQHPKQAGRLPEEQHERLRRYFLGSLDAADPARYRNDQRKLDPMIESLGNHAYDLLLAEVGMPATLPR